MSENNELEKEQLTKEEKNGNSVIKRITANTAKGAAYAFKEYPITLVLMGILSLIGAILVKCENSLNVETVAVFVAILSAGTLFSEQMFAKKEKPYIVSLVISVLVASFYTWLYRTDEPWFFFIKSRDGIEQYSTNVLIIYGISIVMIVLYSMYKKSETDFENFCISAFVELFKTSVIYTAFAIGLCIVVLIFDALIADTGVFLERLEVFLLGIILVPFSLKAISDTKRETTKFAKIIVLYVLMPILALGFLVVYIYILKIVFTLKLPSNEVFGIVAYLFTIGMPIWTMSQHFRDTVIGKIGRYMPLAFIPLWLLQLLAIGIRVANYGITASRYWAMMLLIFEAIYIILFIISRKNKKEMVAKVFLIIPAMVCIGILIPGIKCNDMVIASQSKRISNLCTENTFDQLSAEDKVKVKLSFLEIRRSGCEGSEYVDSHYSKDFIDKLYEYNSYLNDGSSYNYYYLNAQHNDYDIEGYSQLIMGYSNMYRYDETNTDLGNVVISLEDYEDITLDITEYVENARASYVNSSDYIDNNPFLFVGDYKIYVVRLSFEYSLDDGYRNLFIECNVLK